MDDTVLTVIWAGIIVFAVILYVVMDGFDLGIGILFPFASDERDRDIMINSIAPVWDGNQTWLVLGGTALFAAFPAAYAVLMPALYMPVIVLLIGLIFRGVAFGFRENAKHRGRQWWDRAFSGGAVVATIAQGIVLGAFIQGIQTEDRAFVGGAFDWLTPFSLFCGVALLAGFGLLGSTWLIMKTEGALQDRARGWSLWMLAGVLVAIGVVSLWTPLRQPEVAERWFSWPNIAFLSPVPVATALTAFALYRAVRRHAESAPFILATVLFLLSFLGLGISLFPKIVPPEVTIWEFAADRTSHVFLLWGVAIVLPVVLVFTAHRYRVFRGKASAEEEGYH